jgi:protein SCO1/2
MTISRRFGAVLAACLLFSHAARTIAGCPDHDVEPSTRYERSVAAYSVPDVTLVNQRSERVSLRSALAPQAGVALNFVFTTCTTVCPVLTATFARLRAELGPEADGLRLVSLSIDPEHDTPSVLRDYASRFNTGPEWTFLTGDVAQMTQVLRAFDAYTGAKTNHQALTFLRAPGRTEWVRLKGFPSAAELATEYRRAGGD